jgi:hypothetical protein
MTYTDDDLEQRARELWPESPELQRQWQRAMRLVRTTAHGWLLEVPRPRPWRSRVDAPRQERQP